MAFRLHKSRRRFPMLVGEIMSRPVVTVKADTTVKELAALLVEKQISGVPVVDDKGAVIGVVSETDMLHRKEIGTGHRHSWWASLLMSDADLADEFVRYRATKVGDIMNPEVVSISEDARLQVAADLLSRNNVRRVVVVRGEKPAGVITRSDIVRALSHHKAAPGEPARSSTDDAIRRRLAEEMAAEAWARTPYISTLVHDGVVELSGFVDSASQKKALRVLAESVPGVQAVRDRIEVGAPTPASLS
jgi:CBS domain-containing protein